MLLYVACERLLCRGPSGLVVSASDLYSEGPGFESQNFSVDLISLSQWLDRIGGFANNITQTT